MNKIARHVAAIELANKVCSICRKVNNTCPVRSGYELEEEGEIEILWKYNGIKLRKGFRKGELEEGRCIVYKPVGVVD